LGRSQSSAVRQGGPVDLLERQDIALLKLKAALATCPLCDHRDGRGFCNPTGAETEIFSNRPVGRRPTETRVAGIEFVGDHDWRDRNDGVRFAKDGTARLRREISESVTRHIDHELKERATRTPTSSSAPPMTSSKWSRAV
jgi:hypothetical protein